MKLITIMIICSEWLAENTLLKRKVYMRIDSLNLGGFVTSFENFLFCVAEQ